MSTELSKKSTTKAKQAGLSRKLRADITAATLGKLIQKKDFTNLTKEGIDQDMPQAPLYEGSEFNDDKLIDICRFIAFGLSEQNAARAIGISHETLKRWKKSIPGVAEEMARARYLAVGAVASILRALMVSENEKIALQAVQFYLKTRSREFREKQDIEVEIDVAKIQEKVRRDLYGTMSSSEGCEEEAENRVATKSIESCIVDDDEDL